MMLPFVLIFLAVAGAAVIWLLRPGGRSSDVRRRDDGSSEANAGGNSGLYLIPVDDSALHHHGSTGPHSGHGGHTSHNAHSSHHDFGSHDMTNAPSADSGGFDAGGSDGGGGGGGGSD